MPPITTETAVQRYVREAIAEVRAIQTSCKPPDYNAAHQEAQRFVKKHFNLIQMTARHFLMHSRKSDGALNWKRQWELVGYLRPLVLHQVRNVPMQN